MDYSTHPVFITRTYIEWDKLLGRLSVIYSRELWGISFQFNKLSLRIYCEPGTVLNV